MSVDGRLCVDTFNSPQVAPSDAGRQGSNTDTIDLVAGINTIRRRKWLILAVICAALVCVVFYLWVATPKYESNIKILVEGRSGPLVTLGESDSLAPEKESNIDDAVEILRSRALALRVIEQLALADEPEYQPKANPLLAWLKAVVRRLIPASPPPQQSPEVQERIALNRLSGIFLDHLHVEALGRSNVVVVSFTSESPETAWRVTEAVGENYLNWRTEQELARAQKANAWLDERTRELSEKVRQADEATEEYRGQHGLLEGERVGLLAEQISKLSSNLVDASGDRKKAEADLAQVKRLIARSGDVSTAQQILDSALYVRLRDQQLAIEREYAQQAQELGPRHPLILQLQAKQARAEQDIRDEVAKVAVSLENTAAAARQKEASLAADLGRLKEVLVQANVRSVELRALEHEADTRREMLRTMVSDAMEKDAERSPGAQSPKAIIVSEAIYPTVPASPKSGMLLLLGVTGAAVFGVLLAFLVEQLDNTYRSSAQIERDLGIPVLAYVPRLRRRAKQSMWGGSAPFSAAAEAIRAIRLCVGTDEPAAKVIAVVSSEPWEGKSTLAIAIAAMAGWTGQRVLLLDADVRRSGIAQALEVSAETGLADVLVDDVPIGGAIWSAILPGVDVVCARGASLRERDADALTAQPLRLGEITAALRTQYDLIVIDSPAGSVLVDAQVAAAAAEVAVMVVAWGETPRKSVQTAFHTLSAGGAKIVGFVFNKVNDATLVYYTQGEAGYCNRKYYRYRAQPGI